MEPVRREGEEEEWERGEERGQAVYIIQWPLDGVSMSPRWAWGWSVHRLVPQLSFIASHFLYSVSFLAR